MSLSFEQEGECDLIFIFQGSFQLPCGKQSEVEMLVHEAAAVIRGRGTCGWVCRALLIYLLRVSSFCLSETLVWQRNRRHGGGLGNTQSIGSKGIRALFKNHFQSGWVDEVTLAV